MRDTSRRAYGKSQILSKGKTGVGRNERLLVSQEVLRFFAARMHALLPQNEEYTSSDKLRNEKFQPIRKEFAGILWCEYP